MLKKIISLLVTIMFLTVSCKRNDILLDKKKNEIKQSDQTQVKTQIETVEYSHRIRIDSNSVVESIPRKTTRDYYDDAYSEIEQMLEGKIKLDFKRAVFISENAYFNDSLNYIEFTNNINSLKRLCEGKYNTVKLIEYSYPDSIKMKKNYSIFSILKDTVNLAYGVKLTPLKYDFEDNLGLKNWSSTFVTKLLKTGIGNCHSLPYLYKILANELQTEAYLSLAPNHIYIKHRSKRLGWYNTELTSGEFPSDAWVKASGYITLEAIRSGIYMDTISQIQSIALCSYDLAKGYSVKTKNFNDGFVIKCCDLTLKYYPNNINAIILKAETLKRNYEYLNKIGKQNQSKIILDEMQKLYFNGLKLGYREMPIEMYQAWLFSAKEGQNKYKNEEINRTFNNKKQ